MGQEARAAVTMDRAASREADRARAAQWRGLAWAALAALVLGVWFVVTRLGMKLHLNAWDMVAIRFATGALLLAPVLVGRANRLTARAWGEGFLLSLLWGAPFVVCGATGLHLTSAEIAACIVPGVMSVMAGMIGWAVLHQRPARVRLVGYACILGGLLVIVGDEARRIGLPDPLGLAALTCGGTLWAIYAVRFGRSKMKAIQAAALISIWSTILFLPPYLALGLSNIAQASWGEIAAQALYQGVMMSIVATYAFNRAVTLLGAGAAAAIIALMPVIGTLTAIPILDEWPSAIGGIAVAIIALGVLLAARPQKQA